MFNLKGENFDRNETTNNYSVDTMIQIINEDVDEGARKSQEIIELKNPQFSSSQTIKSKDIFDPICFASSNNNLEKSKATSLSNLAGNF